MLYEFNEMDVYRFADTIAGKKRQRGNELEFELCPFCKSKKDKYTFSISLKTGQYDCKRASCGQRGNMITLEHYFKFGLSDDVDRYYQLDDRQFRRFKQMHIETKDKAIEYLDARDISADVVRKYEITVSEQNESILVFPFKDTHDDICFIKYRNMDFIKGETQGSKEWCEKNCKPILFGMNHCEDFEQLVITEGQIDSLSLATAGVKNAVSVPTGAKGFTWIPHCWDWLIRFNEIVIFGDFEHGKITLVDELSLKAPNRIKIVRPEDYMGCKDANEILQKYGPDQLVKAVQNAKEQPLYFLKRLEDVERVNVEDMQAIPTGIKSIDKVLTGGFHEGELIILTGKRGGGKSTFASQILTNITALQDVKSFVYSGELPDFFVRSWIDKQIAGRSQWTDDEYAEIEARYSNKIFIFDNTLIASDDTISIADAVEEAIKRYDVKFILLDNLMTIIESESSDQLYRQQSKFVGRLAQMAKKYNVIIMLIVHPRKMQSGDMNDDVAGASEITNKADIVMSYRQDKQLMPSERYFSISKNRLTGKLCTDLILYYDEMSKRISDTDSHGWTYGFEKLRMDHLKDVEDLPFNITEE